MEMQEEIKNEQSIGKKNLIINNRIHCEMFYFNPVYGQLLAKRNQMLLNDQEITDEQLNE